MTGYAALKDRAPALLAFSWGATCFFPVGFAYAHLLILSISLLLSGTLRARFGQLRGSMVLLPMAAFVAWTLVALAAGPWFPDSSTRMFHVLRVAFVLLLGMLLRPEEAKAALLGFLAGAMIAATIVAVHRLWGLPPWVIWRSLLSSRNNFSSGNMIMLAIASACFMLLAIRDRHRWMDRWPAWVACLALAMTVVEHSLSRNAQILLPALAFVVVVCRFRSWRYAASAVVLVALMVSVAWQFSPTTQRRFVAIAEQAQRVDAVSDYTTGVGERWRMFSEAWNGMVEHPLFGTGVGSWLPRWQQVAMQTGKGLPPEQLERHVEINNPHNDFLLAGMETGVAGLLIMAWMLAQFIRAGWRQQSLAGDLTVVLAMGVTLTALINAPLRDAALGMTLLWLLGCSMAMRSAADNE